METPADSNFPSTARLTPDDPQSLRWQQRRRRLGTILSIIMLTISAGLIVYGLYSGK